MLIESLVVSRMNDKIRLDILQFYYELYKKDPSDVESFEHFAEKYGITEQELIGHVKYLYQKQLLYCFCHNTVMDVLGTPFQCQITAHGIDAIEHPELFTREIPLVNLIINSSINNSQIFQSQNIKIENSFNRIYKAIEESDLNIESKKELSDAVNELESEGKKEEPDRKKMKSLLDKVKRTCSPVYDALKPVIQELITEYAKRQVGL